MDSPRLLYRLKRFTFGLLLLTIPAVFITSVNTLTARANANAASSPFSAEQSQVESGLPSVGFVQSNYGFSESAGTVSISVVINPILTGTLTATVEYLTVNGTATSPGDYIATSGVLTFTSSSSTESFTVQIVDDSTDEPNETVNLVLRNPVNAQLSSGDDTATLTIQDNDPTPTNTPSTQASATPIYVDLFEPNNNIQTAYPIQADAGAFCNLTLWPTGDQDYYRFGAKAGLAYAVTTSNLTAGLDTVLTIFNTQGAAIGSNDDYEFNNRGSQVIFSATVDGFYYARVTNKSTEDPANKRYCIEVAEIEGTPTNTPIPTGTRVPGADDCEENGSFGTACLIGPGTTYDMNFVPLVGEGPDNDFFRLWVKAGIYYSCETLALSSVNDTNMILYDQNGNGLGGNDDKALGDRGSKVDYFATYTGWLYVLVGPYAIPEYALSYLYTYSLICEEDVPTPTATATATRTPSTGTGGTGGTGGGGGVIIPTATLFIFPTFPATPTAFMFETPTPTNTPAVQVNPLPTETPFGGQTSQTIDINLTVYYDANDNFMPELTEGVENVTVTLYDNNTNELLFFGHTNEAGMVHFGPFLATGPVRISIPYLQFNQVINGSANILIRIAPWPAAPGEV